jgi:hypothetical protein
MTGSVSFCWVKAEISRQKAQKTQKRVGCFFAFFALLRGGRSSAPLTEQFDRADRIDLMFLEGLDSPVRVIKPE